MPCWLAPSSFASLSSPLTQYGLPLTASGAPAAPPSTTSFHLGPRSGKVGDAAATSAALLAGLAASAAAASGGRRRQSERQVACKASAQASVRAAAEAAIVGYETPPTHPLFDPLGVCDTRESYSNARDLEIAYGRFAMLAAVGIPSAELYHEQIADAVGLPSRLAPGGQVPHILNAGSSVSPLIDIAVFVSLAGIMAALGETASNRAKGDTKHDPLNPPELQLPMMSPVLRMALREAQRVNGRFAMVSVVTMALVEATTGQPVVEVTTFLH